jgi:hypothetical protein
MQMTWHFWTLITWPAEYYFSLYLDSIWTSSDFQPVSYVNLKNLVWLKNSRTGFRYAPFVEQRRDDKEAISNSWSELNYIYWYASGRTENRYAYRKPVDLNSTTCFHTLHSRACDDRKKKNFLRIYIFFLTGFGYWMLFLSYFLL